MKKVSRKDFIKNTALGAGIFSSSVVSAPVFANSLKNGELATLLDLRKCIGCEACVYACRETNKAKFPEPKKPFPKMFPSKVKVEDWSDKRDVTDRLTPYNWLYIQTATVEKDGKKHEIYIPRRCMHCENPPCVNLCPFGALSKNDKGISKINDELCMGGAKCRDVCPWDVPQRQTGVGLYLNILPEYGGNGTMYKCDRCYDRIDQGQLPACIEACPQNVQKIGPRDEIINEARKIAEEENCYLYGIDENGGTNTVYISEVPFDQINSSIEKGKGKLHFDSVADTMATAQNLSIAVLMAPFVGIAAGILKARNFFKEKFSNE